jgi:2-dehydropantoate 2-reductase
MLASRLSLSRDERKVRVMASAPMKVAIVGAGAMGSLFGAVLSRTDADVWLVDPWQEHMERVQRDGLLVSTTDGDAYMSMNATTDPAVPGEADVVILLSKMTALAESTRSAVPLIGVDTIVVGLQNGLGNVETIGATVPENQIVYGLCEVGADLVGPGHIAPHIADGVIRLKPMGREAEPRLAELIALLDEGGIHAEIDEDIDSAIWKKLALNASFNASCALTGTNAGEFGSHPMGRALIHAIVAEVVAVAEATGLRLDYEGLVSKALSASEQVGDHYPSMAQDFKSRRPTEIDAINGAVVREGARRGVPTPVNETITRLVKVSQDRFGEASSA